MEIAKKCDRCLVEYIPVRKSSRFCSISCSNAARSVLLDKICVICNNKFTVAKKQKKIVCCSRKCGRQLSEQTIDKQQRSEAISRGKKGKYHGGAPHSAETRLVLSLKATERLSIPENNPMFGKKHRPKSRDAMSATRTSRIIAGEYDLRKWAKKGEAFAVKANRTIPYRSTWEKRAIEMLEADPNVTSFQFEPIRIPYFRVEGERDHLRHYIPDFLVSHSDGSMLLVEVKPECYLDAEVNLVKFAVAREWCEKNGTKFHVWTQKELGL